MFEFRELSRFLGRPVQLPPTQELGLNWHPYPPSDPVSVTCLSYHADDPDAEVIVDWSGRVLQPKITGTMMELVCTPSRAARGAWVGGARRVQRSCDVPVYSQGLGMCNLNPDDVLQVSWLALCTLCADVVRINWWRYDVARCQLTFQQVAHEY
jgi:hypothetical protein